ncbi:hypothetical protein B0A50_06890 [Salinomyces thailandicus]|uniref:alpha-1,2-Mannosidase n=1 Tax=Salinomyces thailandicus TaxID=706561 RepID=A0A4U0TQ16_9PEZI|nr:hypothetical protein B0A50_06890 [Salinomyces thailandica]
MFSLRRWMTYLGLAACILLMVSYFRKDIVNEARTRYSQYVPSAATPPSGQSQSPTAPPTDSKGGRFSWASIPVRNKVKDPSPVPAGKPKTLPRVQHKFPTESPAHASERKDRQAAVKRTFERSWKAYKQHAWGHDELAPVSGGVRDGFGGWGASLVDNLDNLWIMGLKSEFEEAVAAAVDIDLSTATTESINVFETTIRHLGGFLSAYDMSGDQRLLDKAMEFGEMLIRAFDTPNKLPITRWKPQEYLQKPQEADPVVLVAEIGSLEMEFTRLSIVTGDPKYYDATARIMRLFDATQSRTHLPGMWPVTVNARDADFTEDTFFTLSAMSDSLYEYFPKMHALLGGLEPMYKKLYDGSMATAIKYNLWRPMVPDDADILMSGHVRASTQHKARLDPQGQHLVCFAGGMFALGGKLFEQPEHVEIGKKLTDGCIWTYKNMPLGIMPEVFNMMPCESRTSCHWNETLWRQTVKERNGGGGDSESALDSLIASERLQKGFTQITDRRYILRPEAIESVFLLYRMTGEQKYQDAAWDMFTAITNASETRLANAAMSDITFSREQLKQGNTQMDSMESFWMAETLKYFYLVFSEPEVVNLDEWVFNTEAHPFKRLLPVS